MLARIPVILAFAGCLAVIGSWALGSDEAPPAVFVAEPSPSAAGSGASPAITGGPAECSDLDKDGCVDSGFDPARDGLAFGNEAATGTLSAAALIALFGSEAVCANVSAKGCVLYPAAAQWARQVNEAMVGGRCEGMVVLAQRIFNGEVAVEDLDPDARITAEVSKTNPAVTGAIETWWATQFLAPVQRAATASRLYTPSSIVQELSAGLLSGTGYTLGLIGAGGAHSVLPLAVHRRGAGYVVSVYDSDYPSTTQEVLVDPQSESWTYEPGTDALPDIGREGGMGTIELTPMAIRALPARAPFDAALLGREPKGKRDTVTLFVTSPDPSARVGVALTIKGKTVDTGEAGAGLPPGVKVRKILGSGFAGSGVVVTINRGRVRSFAAAPLANGAAGGQTPTTLSIDASGQPRITVRSPKTLTTSALPQIRLARSRVKASDEFPLIVVEAGRIVVRGPQVNVANGRSSVNLTLPTRSILLEIDGGRPQASEIRFLSRKGRVLAGRAFPFDTASGRVRVTDLRVTATGRVLDVSEGFARPVPIDTSVLKVLVAISSQSAR